MEKIFEQARKDMLQYESSQRSVTEQRFCAVLEAFREERVSSMHFASSTGYAYDDPGRDKLEALCAQIFSCEAALLRQQIVSGSHAIALALFGNLLPGEELICLGMPYDTLQTIIGIHKEVPGSLRELGVTCKVLDIDFVAPDLEYILSQITAKTKMVAIQRSRGYSLRPSISIAVIERITKAIKAYDKNIIVFVDNCYGEFVELREPSCIGVDLMAGSLIKNPGAGLAPGGGYVAGRQEYVDRAAYRLTVPGAGREMGASIMNNRIYYQALYLAPQVVQEALLSAVFTASVFNNLGIPVDPKPLAERTDIIQTIQFGSPELLVEYCQGIQKYSPIDSFAKPEPWPMPGYDNDIIMASGSFVSGSSIELSADAPLREPYVAFQQGGLSRYHTIYAVTNTLLEMRSKKLI